MRIAILSPSISGALNLYYDSRENLVYLLTEGLAARGIDIKLFAPADSNIPGKLHIFDKREFEEDRDIDAAAWECLHISELFEGADQFDLIHNHFGFRPLTYTGLVETPVVTTIHGLVSPGILPVYKKYNGKVFYISTTNDHRSPELNYMATINPGLDPARFSFNPVGGEDLVFFGNIHPGQGTSEAIQIARAAGKKLFIGGIIQDGDYFKKHVEPHIDDQKVVYADVCDSGKRDIFLGNALAMIYPANANEPLELPAMEAMACGTPVIAFNQGSMRELVENGKNGFLVSGEQEAVSAIGGAKDINRAACRRIIEERFSADRVVEQYIDVYRQVLDKTKREDGRPWGYYQVLSDKADHKVKRIVVYPGQRLSLQRHRRRSEHWYVIKGKALVTLDGREVPAREGETVDIPRNTWHRIMNAGEENMTFIEIQTGDYFGEDDIERSGDDYGRS